MKVGIISSHLNSPLTGIGNYTYYLINNLNKNNCNLRNLSLFLINSSDNLNFTNDKIIISNPFPTLKTYGWYTLLANRLGSCNLDIVHNPTQTPTFFKFKQKYVLTVHDITPFLFSAEHRFGRSFIFRLLFPRTLENTDKIIAVSNSTKSDLIKYFNVSAEKIEVIHEAADERFKLLTDDEVKDVKQKYNIDFPFILYVGTLEKRKNIPTLIKAFYELKKRNVDHKIVIAGKKGWKYKNIFETVSRLNLQNDIFFTGYIESSDLPKLYNAADLFVYPSLYEGFGLPPLEAMACGCPVITSNTSSLKEVIGDAGIMLPPNDVSEFANAMYNVLTSNELRQKMIRKGLERAKMFSWDKCARETLKLYEAVYNEN
jgi:glycosyltransferase involved in cell wall biosynthesis